MEEDPGPGLDKTLLGVLAPGSHHVLAERFDVKKISAGPKVSGPGAGAPSGVRKGAAPAFSALRWLRFLCGERSHYSAADVDSCRTLAATPSVSVCCREDSLSAGALVFRSNILCSVAWSGPWGE